MSGLFPECAIRASTLAHPSTSPAIHEEHMSWSANSPYFWQCIVAIEQTVSHGQTMFQRAELASPFPHFCLASFHAVLKSCRPPVCECLQFDASLVVSMQRQGTKSTAAMFSENRETEAAVAGTSTPRHLQDIFIKETSDRFTPWKTTLGSQTRNES